MKKNKLILFDWGGIVEPQKEGFIKTFKTLFKTLGYDKDDVIDILKNYHLSSIRTLDEYESIFENMKKDFNISCTFDQYLNLYTELFDKIIYYKDVAEYESSLKDKCNIGILSNLSVIDHDRIDKQLNLKNYDYVFLSYELGCQKPNKEIYEKVQSMLPFNKEDILFVDDLEKNINAAKEMGWNTCLANGLELDKIKKACECFINKEND